MAKKILHILRSQQFDRKWLEDEFFPETLRMKRALSSRAVLSSLSGKSICLLFYEPSTRTRLSFQQAAQKLGAKVVDTENAKEFSSAIKGESLIDTIRVANSLQFDAIILRSDQNGGAQQASLVSQIPVINAGDGSGQHPTQALLDIFTIYEYFPKIDGLKIALVGDLKNGRTARSLGYLLGKFKKIHIELVAPASMQMKKDLIAYFRRHQISYNISNNLDKVADQVDVIYMTRAQKERMQKGSKITGDGVRITDQVMQKIKPNSIVLHPLPRSDDFSELPEKFTEDKRVVIFKQVENGLYTRMALLNMVIK